MTREDVRCLLLYPPLTDPTSGYHSLSYLDAFAHMHGFTSIEIRDINIEALDYCAQPEQVQLLKNEAQALLKRLGSKEQLNGVDLIEYTHAWRSQALSTEAVQEAFALLRSKEGFYNIHRYRTAVETVILWVQTLSLRGFAGDIGSSFLHSFEGRMNLNRIDDLTDTKLLHHCSGPFHPFYEEHFLPEVARAGYHVIGINVTYTSQLPYALWLAHRLKEVSPNSFIVLGGTEISDTYKYLSSREAFEKLYSTIDACVIGEGESCFVHILEAISNGEIPRNASNLILNRKFLKEGEVDLSFIPVSIDHEDLSRIPTPDFSKLPWDKYLAPEAFVYYSPSRGCYWNKCTFCDYGLNFDSPTAPWRTDPVSKIVEDLGSICRQSRFVYFSVDVLAPATLLKMAERIVQEGIDIRWSAEIRLEQYWSRERCELLKRSGCVCISVGFESGNQRVLDLIDKGTRPHQVLTTIRNFTEAGIGVQMMGFVGFPSETLEEAMDSIRFLENNRQFWTFGGLGTFVLTSGAIVARQPDRFGIEHVRPFQGDDVQRRLSYVDPVQVRQDANDPEWRVQLAARLNQLNGDWGRPFLGGIDTPHTLMYHDRYGRDVLNTATDPGVPEYLTADTPVELNGVLAAALHGFRPDLLTGRISTFRAQHRSDGRSLSAQELTEFLSSLSFEKQEKVPAYLIRRDGAIQELTEELHRLYTAIGQSQSLGQALASLADGEKNLENYLGLLNYSLRNRYVILPSTALTSVKNETVVSSH